MKKLAIAAGFVALVLATPALADGRGSGNSNPSFGSSGQFHQVLRGLWSKAVFAPPGFSSRGRHFGWSHGRHWGWFKRHHPHWPHHPTSP